MEYPEMEMGKQWARNFRDPRADAQSLADIRERIRARVEGREVAALVRDTHGNPLQQNVGGQLVVSVTADASSTEPVRGR